MKIGDKARDMISELRGEIIGEATYASGAHQFLVQPGLDREGRYQNSVWVDAYRLVEDDPRALSLGQQTARTM